MKIVNKKSILIERISNHDNKKFIIPDIPNNFDFDEIIVEKVDGSLCLIREKLRIGCLGLKLKNSGRFICEEIDCYKCSFCKIYNSVENIREYINHLKNEQI